MERIAYYETGRPLEFAQHLYRASRYAFTTSLSGADSAATLPVPR
jgi:DNA-binding GntR family transcriptional regulator